MIGTVATAPNPIILIHTSQRISDAPGLSPLYPSFDLFCSKYGLIIGGLHPNDAFFLPPTRVGLSFAAVRNACGFVPTEC